MKDTLARLVRGDRLSEEEASAVMTAIMDGEATPAQIGALLAALALRGETEDEIVGFARAMRARATPIRAQDALDTCGTGGDGASTFNISTVASLVAAGCGVTVAKHGNRSASGRCGSSDVLEAFGIPLDVGADAVQRCLDEAGWAFLFAPSFHASTRHAAGPRRELGVRTVFNLLGPLTNPARPAAQVVGVPRNDLVEPMARALGRLGVSRAWVVHGAGLDEISPCGDTHVAELRDGSVRTFTVHPRDAGLETVALDELRASDTAACHDVSRTVLQGGRGAARDAVVLNAAAALVVAGRAADLKDGAAQAARALDDGAALGVLDRVRRVLQP